MGGRWPEGGGKDGSVSVDGGSMAKCRLVRYLRTRVVRFPIVRRKAHLGKTFIVHLHASPRLQADTLASASCDFTRNQNPENLLDVLRHVPADPQMLLPILASDHPGTIQTTNFK
jgi:hypothetical protein